jgi:hypothetical protein
MLADQLLDRLEGVKHTGQARWVAKCPAHKDRRASLSVRELDDKVLVHCFAGCGVDAVLQACGLDLEALFPPRADGVHGTRAERRPFSARDLLNALSFELHVAWVLLSDVASGRELGANERKRAGVARDRCVALIAELRNVR